MKDKAKILMELGKARISLLATVTTMAGYLLAAGGAGWTLLWVTAGVFLLASGASGFNHIQERDVDALMERTRGRPLPSRRMSLTAAVAASLASVVAGAIVVLGSAGAAAAALGLAAVGWYNGIYTPLKRVTAFAAVPGGVVGAIPPVIGWVAGGGDPFDPRIASVAFFFFMWQVPHFWLLLIFSCGSDYERAGLPSLTRTFSVAQISRITFMWILGTVMASVLIPLFGLVDDPWVIAGFFAAGGWLVWRSLRILRDGEPARVFRRAFVNVNAYVVWVVCLLSLGGFLR
jgi:protoheme IX farnesyltransferase